MPTNPPEPGPWATPPYPATGDADINVTWASVGRVLTLWGRFEDQLARVFVGLIAANGLSTPAERAYGAVRTFEGRADMVQAAAKIFFAALSRKPADALTLRDDILDLLKIARTKASTKRNEIAHGIVQRYDEFISTVGADKGFVLGPPHHMTGKRSLSEIEMMGISFGSGVPPEPMKMTAARYRAPKKSPAGAGGAPS